MTASTTRTTIVESATSRAAASAPVTCRKTKPAPTTSAMPNVVRLTSGRVSARRSRAARGDAGSAARDCDWRHSSAPPAATSAAGHATASENQKPSARIVSSTLSTSSPVPSPTSTAARPVRMRRTGAPESSLGMSAQPSA